MRRRAIEAIPASLDLNATPFERLQKFAQMILRVPKAEADKETTKTGSDKQGAGKKKF
jgi:hypothetical protein